MAHKSVIVIQKAGLITNAAYLSRVFKEYSSYMGAALVYDGKLQVAKNREGAPNQQAVTEITEVFGKDADIAFSFAKADKDIFEEDMMPFEVLKDASGAAIMACLMDGGFQGYSVVKSTHTDEYHCVQEFIIPKMAKLYKGCGNDLKALMEELKDPITAKDFQNSWTDKGNITFMSTEGPPVTISSNNTEKTKFNWGWVSNSLGYIEQTAPEKVVEGPAPAPDKPMSVLDKLKAKAAGMTGSAAVKPDGLPAETKTDAAAIVAASNDEYEEVSLPPQAKDWVNKEKIQWWNSEVGYKPDGYKEMKTKVKRKKGTKVGVLAPLAATNVNNGTGPQPDVHDAGSKITAEQIAAEAAADDRPVSDIEPKHVTVDNLPLISPKSKLKIKTEWMKNAEVLKILGEDHKGMFDPKLIRSLSETYSGFMDGVLGKEVLDTVNWDFDMFDSLGKVDSHALAVLAFNLRNEMLLQRLLIPNMKNVTPQKVAM